jgi:lipoprotein-anchoring transpeptidase ErfK/SrfK
MFKRAILFLIIVIGGAVLAAFAAQSAARDVVSATGYEPGTIVVKTQERQLYFILRNGRALRFPVGVGRSGQTWSGKAVIEGKYIKPSWSPPDDIKRDHPNLPEVIPGGDEENPMGDAALTMRGGEYAIHGTNNPGSIGGFVSYGCIRMYNRDIRILYRLADVGTPVIVEK